MVFCGSRYLFGPVPQLFVFIVRMVGEDSACAQLDSSQQLHAACKHSMLRRLRAAGTHKTDNEGHVSRRSHSLEGRARERTQHGGVFSGERETG